MTTPKPKTVYCAKNGKWYTSKAQMHKGLKDSKRKKNKSLLKGRKVRCFVNGKWYTSKGVMQRSLADKERQKGNTANIEHLDRIRADSHTPEALQKMSASLKKMYRKRPELIKNKRNWFNIPGNREKYRQLIEINAGMRQCWTTDPDNCRKLVHKLQTYRDGKQVIEIVYCEREKSTGVVQYG